MYHKGRAVPRDYAKAVAWYRKAAAQGNPVALDNLGLMYRDGLGVPRGYIQAHKWFDLAGMRGWYGGVNHRRVLSKKMTPADISKAQKQAREWWSAFHKRNDK